MALSGLDIGTSGCKCTVMAPDGTILASCYEAYLADRTESSHEIPADTIWQAAKRVISGAIKQCGEPVQALCVTSFGESCVMLDEQEREILPIWLYTDPKGQAESDQLIERLSDREIYRICGHRANCMYFLPKLMWTRNHLPEAYARIRSILPVASYFVWRLCGEKVADYSLAARTLMFDIRNLCWSKKLCEAAEVDPNILPQVAPTGSLAGTVKPDIAKELGLDAQAAIVIGCQDQIAASVGAGAMKPGVAVNGSGTVECVTPVFAQIPDHPALYESSFPIVPACNGYYVTYAFTFTGGALLQWYRDTVGFGFKPQAEAEGKSIYKFLDEMVKPDPSGLLVVPHFAGAATPYMDPQAKGAICGLSLANDAADLYRGCLEGVAYEMRVNFDLLEKAGIQISSLRATGGGARSNIWLQIKADITGKPFETLNVDEAGTVGCLMLAGVATGVYPSLKAAMELVRVTGKIAPAADRARYEPFYRRYQKAYPALKQMQAE